MRSCLYEGWVRHRRHAPVEHEFRYKMFLVGLDLEELDRVFRGRWLWSTRRPAPAWFRRKDYLGPIELDLDEAVRRRVFLAIGRRPQGRIRLVTHLRYFGYVQNPVSFYLCYSPDGERIDAIVAEITNTPWGERHAYVLDGHESDELRFRFAKEFHVSPFMAMEQEYDWSFRIELGSLVVHMINLEHGEPTMDATMVMRRREITGKSLASALLRFPWMSLRVVTAIYLQALRLWLKRVPFHPHPKRATARGAAHR